MYTNILSLLDTGSNRQSRLFVARTALLLATISCVVHAESDWSRGWVEKVVHGADLHDIDKRQCVKPLSADAIAAQDFAVVQYGNFRKRRFITVALPPGLNLTPGERVWVDLMNCSAPLRRHDDPPPKQ